jgi:RNA polymerase sigma-70 factor (ECF subfamily)
MCLTEDKELIARLARGEMSAFQELVESYKKKVYYFAFDMVRNPADAEDISQEVFLKVFRSFKTFKKNAKLNSWIYRISYNACIDHLRKKSLTPEPVEDRILDSGIQQGEAWTDRSGPPDPARTAENALLQAQIELALEKVSIQERTVFLLRHYNDMMLKDIAEVMHLSLGSVKSYLFRCVQKLQKELAAKGIRPPVEVSDESL